MEEQSVAVKTGTAFFYISFLYGLFLTSRHNYLLFHTIAELFSIVVAGGIFMVAWNSKRYMENSYLVFIAISYLFVAGLDLLHTISYKGMPIFTDYDFYANQLWIAARYMESVTLLIAFLFLRFRDRINTFRVFLAYLFVSSVLVASIFHWKIFPVCFVEGEGLTPFKKISEYIISCILLACIILLFRFREKFEKNVFSYLAGSLFFTILSELAFTFYISNYGISNLVGHYFKLFSFFLIYKAIVETGVRRPYDIIFRELVQKEKKLEEARDAADAANRAKSEFLANMSHELRTPLNGILGYAQILKKENKLKESQKSGLDVIERSGTHLLNLINEILDLSKIEARKMEIEESDLLLNDFLEALAKIVRIRTEQKGISFRSEFADDLPLAVRADEKRLGQVLLNLLGNAVKFTKAGDVFFRVWKIETGSPEKMRIAFCVADTGVGIDPEHLKDIFSPFKQVGKYSRNIEGTGLGLSISRKLVRMMGSEIVVQSEPGRGSEFRFDLDLSEAAEWEEKAELPRRTVIGYKGEKRKILVVDDRTENRSVLFSLLSPLGFEIIEAADGEAGVEKALEYKPDLIFMDLVMPKLDGYEATEKILETANDARIIAISAGTSVSPSKIVSKGGFVGFVPKPIRIELLFEIMERSLDIEWVCKEPGISEQEIAGNEETIVWPPPEEVEAIHKSVRIGDIVKIRKQLDRIEEMDRKYAGFVIKMRNLAASFEIRRIRELVEGHSDKV